MTAKVHVANNTGKDIYVMVSKRSIWEVTDIVADLGLMAIGIGEIRAGLLATELPATINNLRDLVKILRWIATIGSGTLAAGGRSAEAAKEVIETFKKVSVKIPAGSVKDVRDTGALDYLSASAIAGVLSVDTLRLIIMTGDGTRTVDFPTNQDHSWIVRHDGVVRAKYGKLWQEDASAGHYPFTVSGPSYSPGKSSLHGEFDQFLSPNESIVSDDGRYRLTYQGDGNLVLYDNNGSPLWASKTHRNPAWRTYMQSDGNLVVYKAPNQPIWASKTNGRNCVLVMQGDGNAVIYDEHRVPLWASQTQR